MQLWRRALPRRTRLGLTARYVMPEFQGSLVSLRASQAWSADKKDELDALRRQALDKAGREYAERR